MINRSAKHQDVKRDSARHASRLGVLRIVCATLAGGAVSLSTGCGAPSKANIELRKQIQQLRSDNNRLQQQHAADQQVIQGLRDRVGTVPTLPTSRLAQLYTAHGIELGNLTGGANLDPGKPGDEGVSVYVAPVDQTGEKIKAAGTFDIWMFDLNEPKDPLVGHCHVELQQAKNAWNGVFLDKWYILNCPWQKVPKHPNLTVKVTFFDELTQTSFTAERQVHVNLPPQAGR